MGAIAFDPRSRVGGMGPGLPSGCLLSHPPFRHLGTLEWGKGSTGATRDAKNVEWRCALGLWGMLCGSDRVCSEVEGRRNGPRIALGALTVDQDSPLLGTLEWGKGSTGATRDVKC